MYSLGTHRSMSHAFAYQMGDYSSAYVHSQVLWLFKGVAPTSFDDIPKEWLTNPAAMMKNSIGMVQLVSTLDQQGNGPDLTFNYTTSRTWQHAKGNVYDENIGRWCIDSTIAANRTHEGIDAFIENEAPALTGSNQPQVYVQYRKYHVDMALVDAYNLSVYNYHPSRLGNDESNIQSTQYGRSTQNYPLVFEFPSEQTVDGLFMRQYANTHGSSSVQVQTWDATALEWNPAFTLALEDSGTPNLVNFPAVTTEKLKCTFNDTLSTDWHPFFLQWVSSVEPADQKDPYDITWGLVSWTGGNQSTDFHKYPVLYFNNFECEQIFNQNQGYPYLLVDVGSPGDGKTVTLNNAEQVVPHEDITVLNMGINFREGA